MSVVVEQIVKPYHQTDRFALYEGDCRSVLPIFADCYFDSIVCDPPYELGFMGKGWDRSGIAYDVSVWRECLRVLKPGGHLLAFGGSRTYHRLACAIEDAGFEIRDQIQWIYGSGFPKSLDVSKAIDAAGPPDQAPFAEFARHYEERRKIAGLTHAQICATGGWFGAVNHGGSSVNWANGYGMPTRDQWAILQPLLGLDTRWEERVRRIQYEREVLGIRHGNLLAVAPGQGKDRSPTPLTVTVPASDAAKQWDGWGTALKPAHEPIVLARKPLIGTVAENVLQHGTGGLNIDGCRIAIDSADPHRRPNAHNHNKTVGVSICQTGMPTTADVATQDEGYHNSLGRWPANVIHDGSDEVLAAFPETSSGSKDLVQNGWGNNGIYGHGQPHRKTCEGDSGSAARFFYCAKATQDDREAGLEGVTARFSPTMGNGIGVKEHDPETATPKRNFHPTVKPISLARYLCRLITPPNGVVLDPFTGSGSLGIGALLEGFSFVGIEKESDYCEIAKRRLQYWEGHYQPELFRPDGTPNLPVCDTTDKVQLSLLGDSQSPDQATS